MLYITHTHTSPTLILIFFLMNLSQKIIRDNYVRFLEKRGVDFKTRRAYWKSRQGELTKIAKKLTNPSISYPSYFTDTIHTYEGGHLSLDQAYESIGHMEASALTSLSDIIGTRTRDSKSINDYTPAEAYDTYKEHIVNNICETVATNPKMVRTMTDFGCGTGELTTLMASEFRDSEIVGVDLSPNYLSQAVYKSLDENVTYVHDNMEKVELDCLQDVITVCYAFHEMPVRAIKNTLRNAYRLLRRDGGRLIIVDMNPEKLPKYPAFIDLSEPHLREYRSVSIKQLLIDVGFQDVTEQYLHGTSYLFSGSRLD